MRLQLPGRGLIPAILLAAAVLLAAAPARAQQFGTIKGRLVWGPDAPPVLDLKVKNGGPIMVAACGVGDIPDEKYVVDPATKGVANGFAYVVNPKGANPDLAKAMLARKPQVVLDQRNCRFVPHSVVVMTGQDILFKSADPVPHNIRYTASGGGLNQLINAGGALPVKFAGPERNQIEVNCDLHPWMKGYFMVLDHPFFAVTKADGSFEIKGVPAGVQRVIVRQPAVGYVTKGAKNGVEVEVKADGVTDMGDLVLHPTK